MKETESYLISESAPVIEALSALNRLSADGLTLFAVDPEGKPTGALTDGDIRRFLVGGGRLEAPVRQAMCRGFSFLEQDDPESVRRLREYRLRGLRVIPVIDSRGQVIRIIDTGRQRSALPFDAVLMAGGRGERLRPLTEHLPKPLLPVGGKCIIDHNVDRLISFGVRGIHVTVNYLADQIEAHFLEPRQGVRIRTWREPEFLGTAGSLRYVEDLHSDTVLLMNADIFTNIDFEDFYLHFLSHGAEMSVAAVPYNISIELGILELDGSQVKGIVEKPRYNYYANAGIYLIRRSALEEIPRGSFFHATDLVEKLIAGGRKVIRYPLNGTWIDIGTPQEYENARDLARHM